MRRKQNRSGFTMAEMLIVVAIIAVLSGVAFIAVQNHQRRMARLECDAIAKEIFVAAQNHLTMAESQGYLGIAPDGYGTPSGVGDDVLRGVYYVVNGASDKMLDLMLPFGSIDETVRSGGSYLIRYQPKPALVLDVFYCTQNGRYKHTLGSGEYANLLALRDESDKDNSNARLNFGSAVLGWYGGEGVLPSGGYLDAPVIEVENAERLVVRVTDINAKNNTKVKSVDGTEVTPSLKLIVTGESSGAMLAIELGGATNRRLEYDNATNTYTVVLDDITSKTENGLVADGLHFADLNGYAGKSDPVFAFMANEEEKVETFIPGENITVSAVAYSNEAFTNIAYGNEETTNSLFADYDGTSTAFIGNIRHLENLDKAISGIVDDAKSITVTTAKQINDLGTLPEPEGTTPPSGEGAVDIPNPDDENAKEDLSWTGFIAAIQTAKNEAGPVRIYGIGDAAGTADNCYRPVNFDFKSGLNYVGNGHSITNITVNDTTNPAGLFGTSTSALKVSDLVLYDFDITGANAGALVGTMTADLEVSNVLAFHGEDSTKDITATASAGGLIGSMAGGKVENCAAALIVALDSASTSGNAGGLIGTVTGAPAVTGCYSGGHTIEGAYSTENYNVTGYGNVGGLIGDAGSASITKCYSTCSAGGTSSSAYVGGLVGAAAGTITDCYAVGLVGSAAGSPNVGAFAGNMTSMPTRCGYFEAVNPGMAATGNDSTVDFEEIDEDLTTYNAFVGAPSTWSGVSVYDEKLNDYYSGFNLRTVSQIGVTTKIKDSEESTLFVATHYGDWPVPGIQVQNTKP